MDIIWTVTQDDKVEWCPGSVFLHASVHNLGPVALSKDLKHSDGGPEKRIEILPIEHFLAVLSNVVESTAK